MSDRQLKVIVRTPHEAVLETDVQSLRVLTETGHVGLRSGVEAQVLAVEAGIAILREQDGATTFLGTAGGLLHCDGKSATLMTPLAVVGKDEHQISDELDRVLTQPSSEMELRSMLGRLEGEIVNELKRDRRESIRGTID
ncbi:MAG: hypothetical protein KDA84_24665 [Planctomycetaceae bacterium]|nr:hypothetical protein [Planctomycetaceae bacterium]